MDRGWREENSRIVAAGDKDGKLLAIWLIRLRVVIPEIRMLETSRTILSACDCLRRVSGEEKGGRQRKSDVRYIRAGRLGFFGEARRN